MFKILLTASARMHKNRQWSINTACFYALPQTNYAAEAALGTRGEPGRQIFPIQFVLINMWSIIKPENDFGFLFIITDRG